MQNENERKTENLVLKEFGAELGSNDGYLLFAQTIDSNFSAVLSCLRSAGGKPKQCALDDFNQRGNGIAKPEFIAIYNNEIDTIFVCECKSSTKYHESEHKDKPSKYAVDGVIYYAKFLQRSFNVIALAVSGTSKDKIKATALFFRKGGNAVFDDQIFIRANNIILSPLNYLNLLKGQRLSKEFSPYDVSAIALDFHETLREIKVSERHKPIFIAGLLLALEDNDFEANYHSFNSFKLLYENIKIAISNVLSKASLTNTKIKNIENAISEVENNTKLSNKPLSQKGSIYWYLKELELKIKPMVNHANSNLDALGIFYHEFIKYTGGDGKGLGIVLTPAHLTEFMCEIAEINKNSKVLDICCGSASFLVTAMVKMLKEANEIEAAIIKQEQIYGIELDVDLYTLANTNMIMRRDGKSNIHQGDCFDEKFSNLKGICNVGLLNPPYSQNDRTELEFVERLCDLIAVNGLVCVVVPLSCAIGNKFKQERERLFKKHSLLAVFSMPDDIFYSNNASTNVCVMLWKAHAPHYINPDISNKDELFSQSNIRNSTYFGFYKDDGFVKEKKQGRIDKFGRWETIKKEWVENYHNKKEIDGISIIKKINHEDEWLAEAYIKTDYSSVSESDFEETIRNYLGFLIKNGLVKQ